MAGHFTCIGLPDQPGPVWDKVFSRARDDLFLDASGAGVAIGVIGNEVQCMTPFFAPEGGLARYRATVMAPLGDPECRFCVGASLDLVDTRTAVQWSRGAASGTFELEAAVFAEEARTFRTEAAYQEAQGTGLRFATQSFVCLGLFAKDPQPVTRAAVVRLAGLVRRVERRTNSLSGMRFLSLRIDSYPAEWDVVMADGPKPDIGAVVEVHGWLVSRPVTPLT